MTQHQKHNPLRIILIVLAIALISYVPLKTTYNILSKGQIRSQPPEQAGSVTAESPDESTPTADQPPN